MSIAQIEIDTSGRLCLTPEAGEFEHIYRATMEVYWDKDGGFLYASKPEAWSYLQWFKQIVAAVKGEYGCDLKITGVTKWKDISPELREQLLNIGGPDECHI
jgi:hypothetical protein